MRVSISVEHHGITVDTTIYTEAEEAVVRSMDNNIVVDVENIDFDLVESLAQAGLRAAVGPHRRASAATNTKEN